MRRYIILNSDTYQDIELKPEILSSQKWLSFEQYQNSKIPRAVMKEANEH